MPTITELTTLNVLHCADCGMPFAITEQFERRRREDHRNFYCPSGHVNVYRGKSEEQKAKERADYLERQLANRDEDLRAARASLTATKGQLTRVRRRAENGVCPYCTRTFANVQRHIHSQHPDQEHP